MFIFLLVNREQEVSNTIVSECPVFFRRTVVASEKKIICFMSNQQHSLTKILCVTQRQCYTIIG